MFVDVKYELRQQQPFVSIIVSFEAPDGRIPTEYQDPNLDLMGETLTEYWGILVNSRWEQRRFRMIQLHGSWQDLEAVASCIVENIIVKICHDPQPFCMQKGKTRDFAVSVERNGWENRTEDDLFWQSVVNWILFYTPKYPRIP